MIGRAGRRLVGPAAFLAGIAGLAGLAGCGELPTADARRIPLDLQITAAGPIIIGDTTVLVVEARDPEGNRVVDPPLKWDMGPAHHWEQELLVLHRGGDSMRVEGRRPATIPLTVATPISNPVFSSGTVSADLQVRYGPITVAFEHVGTDTLLTARGLFQVPTSAVDHRGRPVEHGWFQVHAQRTSYLGGNNGVLNLDTWAMGLDTLVLTHTACPNPCADTLVIDVQPVPVAIFFPAPEVHAASLGETVTLEGVVVDANQHSVPSPPVEWHLADPADSLKLFLHPDGVGIARANGLVRVLARSGDIESEMYVRVHQMVALVEIRIPPHLVGLGTATTARIDLRDARHNPIEPDVTVLQYWTTHHPSIASVSAVNDREIEVVTRGYGSTAVYGRIESECEGWRMQCGRPIDRHLPLRVIPEPDSVRSVSQSDLVVGVDHVLRLWGTIYLPDEVIANVPLFWTSLDPTVASIDVQGFVKGLAPGTARIEGRMGVAVDTVAIQVTDG